MPNPGKPDAYEEILALLAVHPIKTWACAKAGIARASFYAKLDRDPEYAELVERAMADGQAPLIAAVSGKAPERVLSWSDPETFTLRREHKVEGPGQGYKVVIAEQWDPASLFERQIGRSTLMSTTRCRRISTRSPLHRWMLPPR